MRLDATFRLLFRLDRGLDFLLLGFLRRMVAHPAGENKTKQAVKKNLAEAPAGPVVKNIASPPINHNEPLSLVGQLVT